MVVDRVGNMNSKLVYLALAVLLASATAEDINKPRTGIIKHIINKVLGHKGHAVGGHSGVIDGHLQGSHKQGSQGEFNGGVVGGNGGFNVQLEGGLNGGHKQKGHQQGGIRGGLQGGQGELNVGLQGGHKQGGINGGLDGGFNVGLEGGHKQAGINGRLQGGFNVGLEGGHKQSGQLPNIVRNISIKIENTPENAIHKVEEILPRSFNEVTPKVFLSNFDKTSNTDNRQPIIAPVGSDTYPDPMIPNAYFTPTKATVTQDSTTVNSRAIAAHAVPRCPPNTRYIKKLKKCMDDGNE